MQHEGENPLGSGARSVGPNECLDVIAAAEGHRRETIWEHPQNTELREKRKNWNVLLPGDRLYIPDRNAKHQKVAVDRPYLVRVFGRSTKLCIRVLEDDRPQTDVEFSAFLADGTEIRGKTNGDGVAEFRVPLSTVEIVLFVGGRFYEVDVGGLDPVETTTGLQQRLGNLGFRPGPIDGDLGGRTRAAIGAFQREHGLEVSEQLDEATLSKLVDVHGS